jgi:anhydro-N-acetylmuramic acid kinase
VKLIGSHGQTVYHRPVPVRVPGIGLIRSSLQIGDPSVIAERTGITTVADFRARDLAAGGEGAPLTPYVHHLLFQSTKTSRLVINMGGIANVTYLPKSAPLHEIRAFDTGPCNMLLDGLISLSTQGLRSMDRGGRLAAKGTSNPRLLTRLLNHSYFLKRPPKSTGREDFGVQYVRQVWHWGRKNRLCPEDILATACKFIGLTIAQSRAWLDEDVDEIIVGGGGVHNGSLMNQLREQLAPCPVYVMDEQGVNSKAFEAVAFAVLAYQTVHGVATNVPAVTGAQHPVVLGTISPGRYVPSFHW